MPGLQVWAETRREGALEDDRMLIKGLLGQATVQQVFDYYRVGSANPAITPHYQPLQARQLRLREPVGPEGGHEGPAPP